MSITAPPPWLLGLGARPSGLPYSREDMALLEALTQGLAVALANVGEFTGGLAMTATLPPDVRSILLKLEVEFLKKARGTITAECQCTVPEVSGPIDHVVHTQLRDEAGNEVARVAATWRLSPV